MAHATTDQLQVGYIYA